MASSSALTARVTWSSTCLEAGPGFSGTRCPKNWNQSSSPGWDVEHLPTAQKHETWQVNMNSKSTSKSFPGFDRIFLLGTPGNSKAFHADIAVEDDNVFGLTRAEMQPARPAAVTWAMGRSEPVEVIWTTFAVPIIVSDSVVQILRSNSFTGWSLYDVQVQGKQGQSIPGYSGLSFPGRCGPIDFSMSVKLPRIRRPGVMRPVHIGMLFDPASWDGSDTFMPAGKDGWIFVVEEVKQAFEKAKVRNITFKRLDQVEINWRL
jgi:hypothetical protein